MKTIGLIASGKIEALTFLKYISDTKKLKLGSFDVYYFKLNGFEIFLVISEKNMTSARLATSLLIEKISPLLIISFGLAGAIEDDIRVGDIISGNSVTTIENGVFEQYIGLSTIPTEIRKFMLDLLFENKTRIFLCTIITVNDNQVIEDADKIRFSHPVLDMETLGVAQAASRKRIPVFSLRGITHNLAVEGHRNLHTILDYTYNYHRKKVWFDLLTHPWLLLKLAGYYRTKIKVSGHVASKLFSLLQVLSLDTKKVNEDLDYRI